MALVMGAWLLAMSGNAAAWGLPCPVNHLWPERSRLVFQRETAPEGHFQGGDSYLLVDQDDRVRLVEVLRPGCRELTDETLGTAVQRSGRLLLADHVPANEVPFVARRLSVTPQTVVHFVLTWGPMTAELVAKRSDPDVPGYWPPTVIGYNLSSVVCHLYVFRETQSSVELLWKEDQGTGFIDFEFVDVTGDRQPEAVLTVRTDPINRRIRIWRIDSAGGIAPVRLPLEELEYGEPVLTPAVGLKAPAIETRRRRRQEGSTIVTTYQWQWDEGTQQFVITHVYEEERKPVEHSGTAREPESSPR